MRKRMTVLLAALTMISVASCSMNEKRVEQDLSRPVNCATAEGDIRILQSEKAHVGREIAAGVSAVVPIGLVAGVATGTEGTNVRMATGEYNKKIDQKIAEIKATCGVR